MSSERPTIFKRFFNETTDYGKIVRQKVITMATTDFCV